MAKDKLIIDTTKFRAKEGATISLAEWPTLIEPVYRSRERYQEFLADHVARLSEMQRMLYAGDRHALLLIFQAMDAAGKDGVIRHVMSGVNPQGCQVSSFRHPGGAELRHDFFWRVVAALPERGRIGIFNRSYYEDVLIVRIHPDLLRSEGFQPGEGKTLWKDRYRSIRDFERHLTVNNVHVLKFFLHLSKEEQRKRFLARIDEPEKNWKFSEADIKERAHWDDYMRVYEMCLCETSTKAAPWHIVPADDKLSTRLIVSQIILEKLGSLNLAYPAVSADRRAELQAIREQLTW
jgi:PPK2 family polyphosphate:nucleotide phosphotransferase